MERLKSWALWVSVTSLFAFVLKTYFNCEISEFDTLVNMILIVLTGFGILNNPTNRTGF